MGGTSSKSESKSLTDIAISAVQSVVQNCTTTASQEQIMKVGNVGGNVDISGTTFSQGATVNMDCLLTDTKKNEMSSILSNTIEQYANAKSKGLLVPPGGTNADVINDMQNKIKLSLNQNSVQNSLTATSQNQRIQFGNVSGNFVAKNVSMEQTANLVAKSIVQSSAVSSIINEVENKLKQASTSESTGAETAIAEGFFGMIGGVMNAVIMVIGFIVLVALGIVAYFFMGSGSEQRMKHMSGMYRQSRSRPRMR